MITLSTCQSFIALVRTNVLSCCFMIYWSCDQIPMVLKAPSVIAWGFPRNHQNRRTHSTTTHTAREIVSVFRTGREFISVVFCSVHEGVTCRVLGSEVRIGRKTNKFSGCSCMVMPWPTSICWVSQKDIGEHACAKYKNIHTQKSRANWKRDRERGTERGRYLNILILYNFQDILSVPIEQIFHQLK